MGETALGFGGTARIAEEISSHSALLERLTSLRVSSTSDELSARTCRRGIAHEMEGVLEI